MKELIIFVSAMLGIVVAVCLIWYWAMKKEKASLALLISILVFVDIGLAIFFRFNAGLDNTIIFSAIRVAFLQSLFIIILSKIAPGIFEKLGIKRKK